MASPDQFLGSFSNWLRGLSAGGKISLVILIFGSVTAYMMIRKHYEEIGYQFLYTNLSTTDMNLITEKLNGMNVPNRSQGDGILVPGAKVLELRNALALDGLPKGAGVGFELFDKTSFGTTEFQQKLNYTRALQGELARTISSIDGIGSASVHLVIPEQSLFKEDARAPSASVTISLQRGRVLTPGQVRAIAHIVASSVEGLTTNNITIVDNNGELLTRRDEGGEGENTSRAIEIQQSIEQKLERQIEEIVGKVVGSGKVIAKVAATINIKQVQRTEEIFDPEGRVVVSEQSTNDKSSGAKGSPGGTPGAAANLPEGGGQTTGTSFNQDRKMVQTQATYQVSKTIRHVIEPIGEVQKLTAAVLVDGTYEGEGDQATFKPRTPEELTRFEEIVKRVIGFSDTRGDQVKIESMQFNVAPKPSEEELQPAGPSFFQLYIMDNLSMVVAILLIGGILFMLVRLITTAAGSAPQAVTMMPEALIGQRVGAVQLPAPGGGTLPSGDNLQAQIEAERSEDVKRFEENRAAVEAYAKSNTDETVRALRAWILEG